MFAANPSHIPSCDPIPGRERRKRRTGWPLAAIVLLLPLPALAQTQEVRSRDLSIIEDLLVETIQDAIQVTVRAVNTENVEAQEAARASDMPVPIRYVFRSSGKTQARGMYLLDYGAIFTVQVPNMAYTNSAVFAFGGNVGMVRSGSVETVIAGALGEEMQLRAQMSRMDGEIEVLRQRLEATVAESGESSEAAQMLRASLATWQNAFNETQKAYGDLAREERAAEESRRSVNRGEARNLEDRAQPDRFAELRMMTKASPEEIARAEALAQDQRNQVEGAVIQAVVETLGQYGRIMHGLEDNDRLAVVLLPSSYLNPIGSWLRATQRDQEFIISVRFRDVMERDRGDLDEEEFRSRIRIERRLGARQQEPEF